ncbi:MAG: FAD/NAD(P)-binding protein [Oscillospiraceae bacterium]
MSEEHVCHCNPLIPEVCRITDIKQETPDVKTFRIQTKDGSKPFSPLPGQLGMISLLGTGEAMFSITAQGKDYIESSIKKCGKLTDALHDISVGQTVGVRGPYGNHFPIDELKGKNILFIGGGIGLAPLRSFIRHALENRDDYGNLDILYGARTYDDLVFKEDLFKNWCDLPKTQLHVTVDRGTPEWTGNVGFVPPYLAECAFSPKDCAAVLCGPPIMIKMCLEALSSMGFSDEQIITTLEMKMQCGVGKCGRCNLAGKFVCLDGPVFTLAQLRELPEGI